MDSIKMAGDFFFFFSYAREDAEGDTFVDEFYDDLRREIRRQVGLVKEDIIGFRDTRAIGLGFDWSAEVAQALQSSKTLLCLYSPTYFRRPHCGQEVQVFRLRQQLFSGQKASTTLPPVIWVPCEKQIPLSMLDLQYDHADFPESYRRFRLRQLKSLARFRDDYQLFLRDLPSKIISAATGNELPPLAGPPSFSIVSNAFEESSALNSIRRPRWDEGAKASQSGRVQPGPYNLTYVVRQGDIPAENDELVQALIELSSSGEGVNTRTRCHLSLLPDVSGSMNDPLKYPLVLSATERLLNSLPPEDLVSLVLFSTRADVVLSTASVSTIDANSVLRRMDNSGVNWQSHVYL